MENKTYTISDFTKVKLGMTYDEVINIMGQPTGSVRYGIVWDTYNLSDGSYIKLLFFAGGPLSEISIVDKDNREFILKQDS